MPSEMYRIQFATEVIPIDLDGAREVFIQVIGGSELYVANDESFNTYFTISPTAVGGINAIFRTVANDARLWVKGSGAGMAEIWIVK